MEGEFGRYLLITLLVGSSAESTDFKFARGEKTTMEERLQNIEDIVIIDD